MDDEALQAAPSPMQVMSALVDVGVGVFTFGFAVTRLRSLLRARRTFLDGPSDGGAGALPPELVAPAVDVEASAAPDVDGPAPEDPTAEAWPRSVG